MAWSSSPAEKNPWEGRAYLETLRDLPGRFSDAASFSSESICSCQGGGFLQPSNSLTASPSRENTLLVVWKKAQSFFNPGFFQHWRNFTEHHVREFCCCCDLFVTPALESWGVWNQPREVKWKSGHYEIPVDFSLEMMSLFPVYLLKDDSIVVPCYCGMKLDRMQIRGFSPKLRGRNCFSPYF